MDRSSQTEESVHGAKWTTALDTVCMYGRGAPNEFFLLFNPLKNGNFRD